MLDFGYGRAKEAIWCQVDENDRYYAAVKQRLRLIRLMSGRAPTGGIDRAIEHQIELLSEELRELAHAFKHVTPDKLFNYIRPTNMPGDYEYYDPALYDEGVPEGIERYTEVDYADAAPEPEGALGVRVEDNERVKDALKSGKSIREALRLGLKKG